MDDNKGLLTKLPVDALVIRLLNQNTFMPDDFTTDAETGGVYLNRETSKEFLREYQKKLRTQSGYLGVEAGKMSFRGAMQYQVNSLTKAIEQHDIALYQPLRIR